MRQWRMDQIEDMEARLAELIDLLTGHELAIDEIQAEIDELEYEIGVALHPEVEEVEADDNAQRAADMNATLRGGW